MTMPKLPPLDFMAPRIQKFEDTEMGQRCRPRGTAERVVHPTPPMSDAEVLRHSEFSSHSVARAGAARRGNVRTIPAEEVNARRIAAAEALNTPDSRANGSLEAQVATLLSKFKELETENADLRSRLDAVEGNNVTGEAA